MNRNKLNAIDYYRKSLASERRSGIKKKIKYIYETIVLYILGIITWTRLHTIKKKKDNKKIDILLFQHSEKVIKLNRKIKLKTELQQDENFTLSEVPFYKPTKVIKKGLLKQPHSNIGLKYLFFAAYAEYIVSKYRPKLILNDRNGMLLAPFLRDALNKREGKLIQLAHATTVEDDWQFSMNDYDYYFLFGQSSYDQLIRRKLLFGNSKAVLSGSHMVDRSYAMAPLKKYNNNILLLGMGPDREKTNLAKINYMILLNWILKNKEHKLIIKPHPRSKSEFWRNASSNNSNIKLLSKDITLSSALINSAIVISIESNAILEASLANRPIIFLNALDCKDIFSLELFFGPRVKCTKSIDKKIKEYSKNYDLFVNKTASFSKFHLEHGTRGLTVTSMLIKDIISEQHSIVSKPLNSTIRLC